MAKGVSPNPASDGAEANSSSSASTKAPGSTNSKPAAGRTPRAPDGGGGHGREVLHLCSADGSTHTESNKLYRKVKL